jgi:hypothetical protein
MESIGEDVGFRRRKRRRRSRGERLDRFDVDPNNPSGVPKPQGGGPAENR